MNTIPTGHEMVKKVGSLSALAFAIEEKRRSLHQTMLMGKEYHVDYSAVIVEIRAEIAALETRIHLIKALMYHNQADEYIVTAMLASFYVRQNIQKIARIERMKIMKLGSYYENEIRQGFDINEIPF